MVILPKLRAVIAAVLTACLLCPPAQALVTYNDGKEHIFVTGTMAMAYDSNIYAHAGGAGDTIYSAGVLVDYTRRAGWIGVNANFALNLSQFVDNSGENFINPRAGVEFIKTSGRTTGALNLSVARENRADTAANIRDESWNYNASLNFRYPVISRYSISGNFGYMSRVYDNSATLSDLTTYTVAVDLLYALNSERDLSAGYRYRYSETSFDSAYDDHSFTIGVSGKIAARLNGSIRAGYQKRTPKRGTTDGGYGGMTAAAGVTWTGSKRFSLTGQLVKDVSVTATDVSIDTLSATLDAQFVFSSRLSTFANVGAGRSQFLGTAGLDRRDDYFTFGAGVNYTMMQHLKASLAYVFFDNASTFAYSDYDRNAITLTLSSRW
jgi:hypothetical protein